MKKSIATLLVSLLTSATLAQSIPPANLVGRWRAEGNARDSAGRHDGTLPSGMSYARGKIGQAFTFDGRGHGVCIPDSPDFVLTNALTIAGWIYPRQYGGLIFFRGDDRPSLDPWQIDLRTAGLVGFQITDPQNQIVRIEAPIQLNRWQHVAATFGARGNLFLYVNGELAARTNTTLKPLGELDPAQTPGIGIGNVESVNYNFPFNGLIDEMALYSRALNQRQIRAIYQAGNAGGRLARKMTPPSDGLAIREIRYAGKLADDEARFVVSVEAEATAKSGGTLKLFEGDVALLPSKLPDALKIVREGNRYMLVAARPGRFEFDVALVAKIQREEPWNGISFIGPVAAIASVAARAAGTNTDVQLLEGTLLQSERTNGVSRVMGYIGADPTVALRWQGKLAEVARKALLTVDSTISAQITPTVIKYTSKFHYDVVQGNAAQLTLALPVTQALTRLEGEQIRDWRTTAEGDRQTLAIEFIKPIEKTYNLTLYSEQAVQGAKGNSSLNPPQPLNVDRESGALTVSAEDTVVETASLAGLRQVNAPDNAIAAYRFNARPFTLELKLKPVEPVISVADRVTAQLEETRLLISHRLALSIEKAGIYTLELTPQAGFAVADVRGDGVEDWKVSDGKLRVSFSARVLGQRQLDVQLEQALRNFPEKVSVLPLRVAGAAKETSQIGAASAPGIRLRTADLSGLREVPVREIQSRSGSPPAAAGAVAAGEKPIRLYDEILAYTAEQPDWRLVVASEKLAARVVADVFNLVTIGDGIVGGSATIRYSLVNQGVQEFKVRVPAQFKNVEFTGPSIRRKELTHGTPGADDTNSVVWTIGLQDKVWGGYTLVVTYDYPFESAKSGVGLPIAGIHPADVERETGSIAVTTAANLQLSPRTASDGLRRVDESDLSASDRSFITRAVVLAWQYSGDQYDLALGVQRYATTPVLEAVADRTQITSVLTEAGEMLTQASFMVKNNGKQFQRFQLPPDARLWSCYVNGQPAKPERDNDWVLVPLPRDVDRDQAFAVDIVYAQTNGALASGWSKTLDLRAPRTDVPNTYAEWQLFVPPAFRLSHFDGSMHIAQGTTYGLLDAWEGFLKFYVQVLREAGRTILVMGFLAFLVIALVISAVRRGWNGVMVLLAVVAILAVLAAMIMPNFTKARSTSQANAAINNLRQIDAAIEQFSLENGGKMPSALDALTPYFGSGNVLMDSAAGQRFAYLGAGLPRDQLRSDSVLAYSSVDGNGRCLVLYADGKIEQITADKFAGLAQRGLVQLLTPQEIAAQQQRLAIARGQFEERLAATPAPAAAAPVAPPHKLDGNGGVYSATVVGYANVAGAGGGSSTVTTPGAGALAAPPVEAAPQPAAAGIRSLRIELPQTGQPFLFTKVLNIRDEPLSIRARLMLLQTFQTIQMVWQSVAFLIGLGVWWWQWRRVDRNSLILTVALALIVGSVCSLLVQWRALHDALIIGFPLVALAIVAWLVWHYWPRSHKPAPARPPSVPPAAPTSNLPPVMAGIILLLALGLTNATAASSTLSNRQLPIANPSVVSATYAGTVNDRVALLDATLQISSAQSGAIVPLFGDDVVVQQFTVKGGSAELVRDGATLGVELNGRGKVTLQFKMLVKVAGDVTKRRLAFGIPPALSSQVKFTLDEAGADVDFPTAISFKRILNSSTTRVDAVIGSGDRVELLWTPRVKRAAEVAATVFCRNTALVTFGGGVVNVRATLDYQITQGELRQARVQLPAGQRLLRVEGKDIRTWEVKNALLAPSPSPSDGERVAKPGEGQTLVVDLLKGVSSSWRLIVETESALDALPVAEPVTVPRALEVKRETGLVALRGTEELGLSIESASGLDRVEAEEFTRAGGEPAGELFSVFRFSNPAFNLRVRAELVRPEIEAVVRNDFRVSAEQVALSATINYAIKRAGLFALRAVLPDGYRVERVTGSNVLQWTEKSDGLRALEVTLKDRTSGPYTLGVELTRSFKELPPSLTLAGVHPLDAAKLTGYIAVSPTPGVGLKTESLDGLTEIPVTSLPDAGLSRQGGTVAGSVLAYKFISPEPKSMPEWRLSVATEAVAAWVRAEVVNTFTLTDTLVSGRALVRYDIANAPVKELRVKIPAAFKNVEISGPNVRSRTRDGDVWRVELQSPTRGFYVLTVNWDQPRPATAGTLEVVGVSVEGVERETGLLAIAVPQTGTPLQVSEAGATALQRVDTGDSPNWAGQADPATALAYRYVRPGYLLTLNVRRFDDADVLQALVDRAQLTSVVAEDGQMMTELSLSVRNNGRQFLEIALPPGATNWSASVAGAPVQPSLRDGKLLLPIQQSGGGDGTIGVELTYVGASPFPRNRGQVTFVSPQFDVPLKNARWEVYLPPDYAYQDFQGTMTREAAAPRGSSWSFSLLDYSRMEQANKAQAQVEAQRDVAEAQRQLSSGNLREASAMFYRSKVKSAKGTGTDGDVKQLEKDLQSAQASNLINAQNDFTWRNYGQIAGGENAPAQAPGLQLRYDNAAAEQQSAKLEQAQEIVAPRVQPLHVNLPVRGVHYTFTQVLQTQTGKPMTVQMLAANTRAVNWPMRGLMVVGAFLILWVFVAVVSRATRRFDERLDGDSVIA